jgi:tripartite-type tricarboxylate transporter receptor subunit TctC
MIQIDDNSARGDSLSPVIPGHEVPHRLRRVVQRLGTVVFAAVATISMMLPIAASAADPYPIKPIRFIVPFAAGGQTDVTSRLIAKLMSDKLGQTVIVENRSGGDALVGILAVLKEPADGYTLLATADNFPLAPSLKINPGYDPVKDFAPIGPMLQGGLLMVVGADQPYRSVKELVAAAKLKKMEFGSAATSIRLPVERFLKSAGVEMLHIPYRGSAVAIPDLITGRITMMFDAYATSGPMVKSGKTRALAVTSPVRLASLPNVPTLMEEGVNFSHKYWIGLLAKSGTPKEVVDKLSEALQAALKDKEYVTRVESEGGDPSFMTPQVFGELIARQVTENLKLTSELGITKD